mmetsp:Transcript_20206/g.38088  ORF Transcript_20206/g.38088 Transcript_20206/m.38088 type:complete len:342 (+) Transcript_20206:711-1736(+)
MSKREAGSTFTATPPAEGSRQGWQNRRIAHCLHTRIPIWRRSKAILESQLRDDTTTRRIRKRYRDGNGSPRHSQRCHLPLLLRPPLRHRLGMRTAHPPHRRRIRGRIHSHAGRHPGGVGVHDRIGPPHLRAAHQSMRRDGKGAECWIARAVHELPRRDGGEIGGIGISRRELRGHGRVLERGGRSAHAPFGCERRGRVGERGHDGYRRQRRRRSCGRRAVPRAVVRRFHVFRHGGRPVVDTRQTLLPLSDAFRGCHGISPLHRIQVQHGPKGHDSLLLPGDSGCFLRRGGHRTAHRRLLRAAGPGESTPRGGAQCLPPPLYGVDIPRRRTACGIRLGGGQG